MGKHHIIRKIGLTLKALSEARANECYESVAIFRHPILCQEKKRGWPNYPNSPPFSSKIMTNKYFILNFL